MKNKMLIKRMILILIITDGLFLQDIMTHSLTGEAVILLFAIVFANIFIAYQYIKIIKRKREVQKNAYEKTAL